MVEFKDVVEDLPFPASQWIDRITAVVRKADESLEAVGQGSTRGWVRDHFLPALADDGLHIAER